MTTEFINLSIFQEEIEHRFRIESIDGIIHDAHDQIYDNLSDTIYDGNNSYLNSGLCRSGVILKINMDYSVNEFLTLFENGVLYLWDCVPLSEDLKEFLKHI